MFLKWVKAYDGLHYLKGRKGSVSYFSFTQRTRQARLNLSLIQWLTRNDLNDRLPHHWEVKRTFSNPAIRHSTMGVHLTRPTWQLIFQLQYNHHWHDLDRHLLTNWTLQRLLHGQNTPVKSSNRPASLTITRVFSIKSVALNVNLINYPWWVTMLPSVIKSYSISIKKRIDQQRVKACQRARHWRNRKRYLEYYWSHGLLLICYNRQLIYWRKRTSDWSSRSIISRSDLMNYHLNTWMMHWKK